MVCRVFERTSKNTVRKHSVRWLLVIYDVILFVIVSGVLLWLHPSQEDALAPVTIVSNIVLGLMCVMLGRFAMHTYSEIWRYGNMRAYLNLIAAYFAGGVVYMALSKLKVFIGPRIALEFVIICTNLLLAIVFRTYGTQES